MYIIGITGPSGAGKTTALRVLESMGGQVFDCDAVYHEMLETDGELLGRIEAAFPGAVKDYALDRKTLGAKVFADPAGLEKLTAITQPLVAKRVISDIEASAPTGGSVGSDAHIAPVIAAGNDAAAGQRRRHQGMPPYGRFAVIDAIGLFESGLGAKCDLTVAVVADPEVRVRRLMARDGITQDYARARIAAQKPVEFYTVRADLVLENNGTEEAFAARCRALFSEIPIPK